MIDALRDFIRKLAVQDEPRSLTSADTELALAALLVHAVAIDGVVSEVERSKLREVLARNFGLTDDALEQLLRDAEAADDEAVDLYRFTSVLKHKLSEDERVRVVENLWEITFADGVSHELEENLVWRVAELLGVNRRDRIAVKHLVAENKSVVRDNDD